MARIVVMLNRLVIGGAPLDTVQLAGYLSEKHEVYLLVGEKNKDEVNASFLVSRYSHLQVIHLKEIHRSVNVFRDLQAFIHVRKILKKLRPDIVHTNGAKPGVLGRIAAASLSIKVIIHTYHGHVFHSYYNSFISLLIVKVERVLAKYSNVIIAISKSQENELVNKYKICEAEKIRMIGIGIETDVMIENALAKRKIFREEYLISDDEIAIGIVGRIVPVKGHSFFINVMQEVIRKVKQPVRFFIIGDGLLRNDLMHTLKNKNISFVFFPEEKRKAIVTFTSWIFEIAEVMNGLDIVALTSLNEGVPVTLLEASAAGKPVISTNVGSVSEIIENGKTGFVTAVNDTADFSEKLLQLIDDAQLRTSMGDNGQNLVRKNYRKDGELKAIEELYERLLLQQ